MKMWMYFCGLIQEVELKLNSENRCTGYTGMGGNGVVFMDILGGTDASVTADHFNGFYDTRSEAINATIHKWTLQLGGEKPILEWLKKQVKEKEEDIALIENKLKNPKNYGVV